MERTRLAQPAEVPDHSMKANRARMRARLAAANRKKTVGNDGAKLGAAS